MKVKIYTPLILAKSECLAVSTVVDIDKLNNESSLSRLVNRLLLNNNFDYRMSSSGIYDYIRAMTAIYGGIMLFYTCNPVTPISRIYPRIGIDVYEIDYGHRKLSDSAILKAWSLTYSGSEEKGLQMLSGPTIAPRGLYWTPGNTYKVLVTGLEY